MPIEISVRLCHLGDAHRNYTVEFQQVIKKKKILVKNIIDNASSY